MCWKCFQKVVVGFWSLLVGLALFLYWSWSEVTQTRGVTQINWVTCSSGLWSRLCFAVSLYQIFPLKIPIKLAALRADFIIDNLSILDWVADDTKLVPCEENLSIWQLWFGFSRGRTSLETKLITRHGKTWLFTTIKKIDKSLRKSSKFFFGNLLIFKQEKNNLARIIGQRLRHHDLIIFMSFSHYCYCLVQC